MVINNPRLILLNTFNGFVKDFYFNNYRDIAPYQRYEAGPHFYYKPDIHKMANGLLAAKGIRGLNAVRIITKKNIPLFITATNEDFINFTIKLNQLYIKKTH